MYVTVHSCLLMQEEESTDPDHGEGLRDHRCGWGGCPLPCPLPPGDCAQCRVRVDGLAEQRLLCFSSGHHSPPAVLNSDFRNQQTVLVRSDSADVRVPYTEHGTSESLTLRWREFWGSFNKNEEQYLLPSSGIIPTCVISDLNTLVIPLIHLD